jgi:hypothetical protein
MAAAFKAFLLLHYVKMLEARGYNYGSDFVPHDAKAREFAGGATEGQGAKTRIESMFALKRKPRLVADHKVLDGIEAARVQFRRIWFDKTKCKQGLEALRQYRSAFDEKLKVFKNEPQHDWTSHAADAFRYMCLGHRELMGVPLKPEKPPVGIYIKPAWEQKRKRVRV